MSIKFSECELDYLTSDPEALRLVKQYHDIQITMGEPMGFDCSGNDARMVELETEAKRLEVLYEQG